MVYSAMMGFRQVSERIYFYEWMKYNRNKEKEELNEKKQNQNIYLNQYKHSLNLYQKSPLLFDDIHSLKWNKQDEFYKNIVIRNPRYWNLVVLSSLVILVSLSVTGSSLLPQLVNNTGEQRIIKKRRFLKCFIK